MKARSYFLVPIAAALCAGCGVMSPYQESFRGAGAEATPQDCFAAALQEHMPGVLTTNRVPGAVVSYIRNGEVAWTKAFGVANVQSGTPMRSDMVFNHGSSTMLDVQPNPRNAGLGYGVVSSRGEKFLTHSGANPGWFAHFQLSVDRREEFVIANNSSRGGRVNESVGKLWYDACRDTDNVREQR